MMRQFVLTHVVEDVSNTKEGQELGTEKEEHFGAQWDMGFVREKDNLGLYLYCEPPKQTGKWSIQTECEFKLISGTGAVLVKNSKKCYTSEVENSGRGFQKLISWEEMMKNYVVDDKVTIQIHGKIIEMTGIEKKKLRNFDEGIKELSDVVLVVKDQKFYVSKLFLATQSTYFKSLLVGKFKESEMKEIKLEDIDPTDFQNFLEVLYGDPAIDDNTVSGILNLADMYDAETVTRKCGEFLIEKSDKTLKEKLELSTRYKLKNLKTNCLLKIKTVDDIKSVMPGSVDDLEPEISNALLQKLLSFH